MRKALTISLGGIAFYIEKDAHSRLQQYFESLEEYFKDLEDKGDIISDIENRIAELLTISQFNPRAVIRMQQVNDIITKIGIPEQFDDVHSDTKNSEKPFVTSRKLFRDPEGQILLGLLGGISQFFSFDPIIIRMIFLSASILLCFLYPGFLIIIPAVYVLVSLFIPEARNVTDKASMKAGRRDLESIRRLFTKKETHLENKQNNVMHSLIGWLLIPFEIMGIVLRSLIKIGMTVIPRLTGFALVIASFLAFLLTTLFVLIIFFFRDSPEIDLPVTHMPSSIWEYVTVLFLYFVAVLPIIVILLLGAYLLFNRRIRLKPFSVLSLTLVGVWVLSILAGAGLLLNYVPKIESEYEANYYSSTENLPAFSKVEIHAGKYYHDSTFSIEYGDMYSIRIEGNKRYLIHQIIDTRLVITLEGGGDVLCLGCMRETKVVISTPDLEKVSNHSGRVSINGFESIESLEVEVQGRGSIEMQGRANTLTALLNRSSMNAFDFEVQNSDITLLNNSQAFVQVEKALNAEIEGISQLTYKGNPTVESNVEIQKDVSELTRRDLNSQDMLLPYSQYNQIQAR